MADTEVVEVKAPGESSVHFAQRQAKRAVWIDRLKTSLAAITGERDTIKAERDKLITENQALQVKADTSVAAKRVQELEGEIRQRDHRKAFDKVAKARGASEQALDDLWTLSGYKAEAPEADETAIGTLLDAQKTARPYLFAPNGTTTPPPPPGTPPPPKPGPGSGQGGSTTATTTFSPDQLSDPKFVMANFEAISQASSERMKRGEI